MKNLGIRAKITAGAIAVATLISIGSASAVNAAEIKTHSPILTVTSSVGIY